MRLQAQVFFDTFGRNIVLLFSRILVAGTGARGSRGQIDQAFQAAEERIVELELWRGGHEKAEGDRSDVQ